MPSRGRVLLPEARALTRSLAPAALQAVPEAPATSSDPTYKTPYAIHVTGGMQHAFNEHWLFSADYTHEQGNHGYRAFPYAGGANLFSPLIPASDPNYAADQANVVPNVNVFESDNRSSYNALMLHLQGNMRRFNLVANYQFSKAQTWGCLLGELFDYVDGVCTRRVDRRPDSSMHSAPATTVPPAKTFAIVLCWPARCTFPAVSNSAASPSSRAPVPSPSPMRTTPPASG